MNAGYAAALATALVWGLTFVSTKMLLVTFTPVEILFIRFVIGTVVLFIIAPRRLRTKGWDEEKYFIIAGLSGVSLYYFMENVALVWSTASNVGVIVSTAPFFTALFSSEKKSRWFFIGFIAAILGIAAMSFGSLEVSKETLLGDMLSLLAAATWGIYSVASKKISTFGYSSILTTRRSFLYGIIAMYICSLAMDMVVYGQTNAKLAQVALDKLQKAGIKILGAVIGHYRPEGLSYGKYGYYKTYSYYNEDKDKK